MAVKKVLMGNHAVSHGVKLSRVQVISAYPITPQTHIVEKLSEMCANGDLDAKFIKVESEHSAMATLVGASSVGVRSFTATSSQGLALMHEILHWVGIGRLPIVMANVNRTLAPGWNIWTEQTDSLSQRDTGWMQWYCETNQEVLDTVIQAFKVAERTHFPVMMVYDAFVLSHTYAPVEIPDQETVDRYLPPLQPGLHLDSENPMAFGALTPPEDYMELRYIAARDMARSLEVIEEEDKNFGEMFGRSYGLVEEYRTDGADTVLVTAGSMTATAREAVDALRKKGRAAGLVKLKVFRPFPFEQVRNLLKRFKKIAVVDRNLSPGLGGIFAAEIANAMAGVEHGPQIYRFIVGLGGRDVTPETFFGIADLTTKDYRPGLTYWVGLKGGWHAI